MFNIFKKKSDTESTLYNNILLLSRNKLFFTKFNLGDTFQNRINLIFIHISFLFNKVKHNDQDLYKQFYQNMFDYIFNKIELNMREIGYGDVSVNKNMKFLVRTFYDILLNCEKYKKKSKILKKSFFYKYLSVIDGKKANFDDFLINYFDKYEAFCFDLSSDSVLKGEIKFNYN
jgi:cytochrome b pre-mRNA-processing protein 3